MSKGNSRSVDGRRPIGLSRRIVFAIITTACFFAAANEGIERLERRGIINSLGEGVMVQAVLEDLYSLEGDRFVSTSYADASTMPLASFAADKGEGWRLFVTGGSFAMGSPYTGYLGDELWAGIPAYLRHSLGEASDNPIEVINAAAGGQDSSRVAALVRNLLRYEADALLVATCNNEGALAPSMVEAALVRQGSYRLMRRLLERRGRRTWQVHQDGATEAIRAQFRQNIDSIVRAAEAAGVRVYLATLPINLDYSAFTLSHGENPSLPDPPFQHYIETIGSPLEDVPEGWEINGCYAGFFLGDAGYHAEALPWLQRCLRPRSRSQEPQMARWAAERLAWSWLRRGEREEQAREVLARQFAPCTIDGMVAHAAGRHAAAVRILGACERDIAEVLRWSGLSEAALGNSRASRALLRQSVELRPRNRCRPSFNDEIRAIASVHEAAVLVDLEAAHEALDEGEWFLDYCHMTWRGCGEMGKVVFEALRRHEASLVPRNARPLDLERFGDLAGAPRGDAVEHWRHILHRGDYPAE